MEKEIKLQTLEDIRSFFNGIDLLLVILDSKIYILHFYTHKFRKTAQPFWICGVSEIPRINIPKKKNTEIWNIVAQDFLSGDTSPGNLVRSWHPLLGIRLTKKLGETSRRLEG